VARIWLPFFDTATPKPFEPNRFDCKWNTTYNKGNSMSTYSISTLRQRMEVYEYAVEANSEEEALAKLKELIKVKPLSAEINYTYLVEDKEEIDIDNITEV